MGTDTPRSQLGRRVAQKLLDVAEQAITAGRLYAGAPKASDATGESGDHFVRVERALQGESLTRGLEELESFARQMGDDEVATWAKFELSGYLGEPLPELPLYRQRFGGRIRLPGRAEKVSFVPLRVGITEMELVFRQWREPEGDFGLQHPDDEGVFVSDRTDLETLFTQVRQEAQRHVLRIKSGPSDAAVRPAPNFARISSTDPKLSEILAARWREAQITHSVDAYLSTIILLGSILEGVALWRVEQHPGDAVRSKCAPKDKTTTKTKPIPEWKLSELLAVVHDLGWLSKEVSDFNASVRDYRNLVHPREQRRRGSQVGRGLCNIAFEVVRAAIEELVR